MKPANTTALLFGSLPRLAERHSGVAQCLCYMAVNCSCPIKLKDLEKVAGLSRRGFQKAFRKHAGSSPGQVLRHLRIENAKRLLMESDEKLEVIASHCGYRSANTFCIAFRQVVGIPPKKFQRQAWFSTYRRRHQDGEDSSLDKHTRTFHATNNPSQQEWSNGSERGRRVIEKTVHRFT